MNISTLTEEQSLFAKWTAMQDTPEGRLVALLLKMLEGAEKEISARRATASGFPLCDCRAGHAEDALHGVSHEASCSSLRTYFYHVEENQTRAGVITELYAALEKLRDAVSGNHAFFGAEDGLHEPWMNANAVLSRHHLHNPDMEIPF